MTKTIYLLVHNETKVHWSFNKEELVEQSVRPYYCCKAVLSVEVSFGVAAKLQLFSKQTFVPDTHVDLSVVPQSYLESSMLTTESERLFIIFSSDGKCYWSPSGNNLNGFYNKAPHHYLGPASRVELAPLQQQQIYGFWDFAIDNF